MRSVSATLLVACTCGLCFAVVGCGASSHETARTEQIAPTTPEPAPAVTLSGNDRKVWTPLPPDRSAIPVLLYHGIGPESDFSNDADASYGIAAPDFAKQMTMMKRSGYQTVSLSTFRAFVQGKPVRLPPRPMLLTFDDARRDSWTGGDGILRKLGYTAVLFVDVGRVDGGDPEYMTWNELRKAQRSGRWQLQLHSGHGHVYIQYGPGPNDTGPYYAYEKQGEDFAGWQKRARSDIEWGQRTLARHIRAYEPLAFAPPYGSYGQDGTNDPEIPPDLLGWLTGRYQAVFTQDVNARAHRGQKPPYGRLQVTRADTGGAVHEALLSGDFGQSPGPGG
jgi:poly-beta-1,6-N-acetyl-D-glucosamine N-deacetylase